MMKKHTLPDTTLDYGALSIIARALDRSVTHVSRMVYGERPWTPGALEVALAALADAGKEKAKAKRKNAHSKPGRDNLTESGKTAADKQQRQDAA